MFWFSTINCSKKAISSGRCSRWKVFSIQQVAQICWNQIEEMFWTWASLHTRQEDYRDQIKYPLEISHNSCPTDASISLNTLNTYVGWSFERIRWRRVSLGHPKNSNILNTFSTFRSMQASIWLRILMVFAESVPYDLYFLHIQGWMSLLWKPSSESPITVTMPVMTSNDNRSANCHQFPKCYPKCTETFSFCHDNLFGNMMKNSNFIFNVTPNWLPIWHHYKSPVKFIFIQFFLFINTQLLSHLLY